MTNYLDKNQHSQPDIGVDLFDTVEIWNANPREAFRSFVQSIEFVNLGRGQGKNAEVKPLLPSSSRVYLSMFDRFSNWMELRNRRLGEVTSHDINMFLDEPSENGGARLASKIRVVYVRLLERVFQYLKIDPNPASKVVKSFDVEFRRGREESKAFLDDAEIMKFMSCLPPAPRWDSENQVRRQIHWEKRRNRAILAILVGAGLKVSEVVKVRTESLLAPERNGAIPIQMDSRDGEGTGRPHRPVVSPFAATEVQEWLKERVAIGLPGPLLFPTAVDNAAPLDKSTVYRYAQKTFVRAGIDVKRMGGRTLRNTYAIQELEHESLGLVLERLGHRVERSTERYLPYTKSAMLKLQDRQKKR